MLPTDKNDDKLFKKKIKKFLFLNPKDLSCYKLAFLHKSISLENFQKKNNERLEFLGDSILSAVVASFLFSKFPKQQEGFLTDLKTRLVKRQHLNKIGKKLGLHHFLNYNGKFDFEHQHILGNTFESLLGAIFIDKGFEAVKQYWNLLFEKNIVNWEEISQDINYKGELINWAQKNNRTIEFTDISTNDKKKVFFISKIFLDGKNISEGGGYSKKESQQQASQIAFQKLIDNDAH